MEMDEWMRNIGWVTVLTALLVLIKRHYDRIDLLQEWTYENSGVYAAAYQFACGASAREVSEPACDQLRVRSSGDGSDPCLGAPAPDGSGRGLWCFYRGGQQGAG